MGPTGGEGSAPPLCTVGPQGAQDDEVGGSQQEEVQQADHATVSHHQQADDIGVGAGKLQQGVKVTDKVIDHIRPTEGQLQDQQELNQGMHEAPQPSQPHQQGTEMPGHDSCVVQGLADGHVLVIGHHCEQDYLSASKKMSSKELSHATLIGDGSPLMQGVSYESRGHRRRIKGINKGQVGQEKIHRGNQRGTIGDGDHDENIATNCDPIYGQKDHKENSLYF